MKLPYEVVCILKALIVPPGYSASNFLQLWVRSA